MNSGIMQTAIGAPCSMALLQRNMNMSDCDNQNQRAAGAKEDDETEGLEPILALSSESRTQSYGSLQYMFHDEYESRPLQGGANVDEKKRPATETNMDDRKPAARRQRRGSFGRQSSLSDEAFSSPHASAAQSFDNDTLGVPEDAALHGGRSTHHAYTQHAYMSDIFNTPNLGLTPQQPISGYNFHLGGDTGNFLGHQTAMDMPHSGQTIAMGAGNHPPPPPPMPAPPILSPHRQSKPPPLAYARPQRSMGDSVASHTFAVSQPDTLARAATRTNASSRVQTANMGSTANPRARQQSRGQATEERVFRPSQAELDASETPRAQQALETWYERLNELNVYRVEHGHCKVPQKYEPNRQLGVWVNKQRMEKKSFSDPSKKSSLTHEKVAALESLGFVWAEPKGDEAWNKRFNELVDYKAEHSHCNVPTKYADNPALGRWVSTQRSQYKKEYCRGNFEHMTQDRFDRLDRLGFKWNMMDAHSSGSSHHSESSQSQGEIYANV